MTILWWKLKQVIQEKQKKNKQLKETLVNSESRIQKQNLKILELETELEQLKKYHEECRACWKIIQDDSRLVNEYYRKGNGHFSQLLKISNASYDKIEKAVDNYKIIEKLQVKVESLEKQCLQQSRNLEDTNELLVISNSVIQDLRNQLE